MLTYKSVCFLLLNICNCLPQILNLPFDYNENVVPRIVSGWPAKLGDVPYQLAFKALTSRSKNVYKTFCGGAIIGPTKVLSAAHCFEEKGLGFNCFSNVQASEKTLQRTHVVAGNLHNRVQYNYTSSAQDGQWRKLEKMIYPHNYKFPQNDISVGFVTTPFVFNDYVAPISYTKHWADYRGSCLASGYGRISKAETSDMLLLTHLVLESTSWCNRVHGRNMAKFVCTSNTVSDVGKGDSGGPLVCSGTGDPNETAKGILVGIVSGNRKGGGSFFTRVSSYSGFVARGRSISGYENKLFFWISIIYGRLMLF